MKRYAIFALTLVLGCTILTGCRRGNNPMETVSPTVQTEHRNPTVPATTPTTLPTHPIVTEPTVADPTGVTSATEGTAEETETGTGSAQARTKKPQPNMR